MMRDKKTRTGEVCSALGRFWVPYGIACISLVSFPLISHICSAERVMRAELTEERALAPFNGVWRPETSQRIDNLDGTFDVITLNFTRLVNIPVQASFAEFSTRWQELPRGLDVPAAFYGDFTNRRQDGCITWNEAVNRDISRLPLAELHASYVRQCGGWAGYEVATDYALSYTQQHALEKYGVYRFIAENRERFFTFQMLITVPALWCLFWQVAGLAYRSAQRAVRAND